MFSTVRSFIKASIAFLLLGLVSGLSMVIAQQWFDWTYGAELVSAHTHVILVGSAMMMIMGVALWSLPRSAAGDRPLHPGLVRAVYWVMTVSTAVRFLFEAASAFEEGPVFRVGIPVASFLQVAGIGLFVYAIRGRIRLLGGRLREEHEENF